jgi:hypothetical protein
MLAFGGGGWHNGGVNGGVGGLQTLGARVSPPHPNAGNPLDYAYGGLGCLSDIITKAAVPIYVRAPRIGVSSLRKRYC